MAKTVIVVRDEATLYEVATSYPMPSGQEVEIVLDRRVGDRRQRSASDDRDERRRTDRRVNQDAQARLQAEGLVVVQK